MTFSSVFVNNVVVCEGQSSSCVVPVQQTNLEDHINVFEDLVENTNFTLAELPLVVNISGNGTVFRKEIEEISTELLSNEEKGRACLKNLTKCLENGKYFLSTQMFSNRDDCKI